MEEVKLNMLMIGKTGHGKSATANMILNKRVNITASNTTSQTKVVSYSFANFDNYMLLVVDGPGIEDTDLTEVKDKEAAAKNMTEALAMCYGGVDAFLFVYRFGNRMTTEERAALVALKQIFGNTFMKHVIVVLTYGDLFHSAMEDEKIKISFQEWCRKQTGEFQTLLKECGGRVVLVNNKEKDDVKKREQIGQIVELTHNLQKKSGRYTSECFKLAEQEREYLILNCKAPHLRRELQEMMGILCVETDDLSPNSSDSDKARVRAHIMNLKHEIEVQDDGYGVLLDLLTLTKDMENNLNNAVELHKLTSKLEIMRRAVPYWNRLAKVCSVVGGVLVLVKQPIKQVSSCQLL